LNEQVGKIKQLIINDPNIDPQFKTAMALSDALLNPKPRKMTAEELIQAVLVSASRLDRELAELAATDTFDANIEESQYFVQGIITNIMGYKKRLNEPYVPHEPHCGCDECVAARSDEHFDRKRDGELMRDFNHYP
jgi:hypothetical protein